METHTIQPTLGITQCLNHIAPGKAFIVGCIVISSQATVDELALLIGEKLGRIRVVIDEPVCSNSYYYRSNALLKVGVTERSVLG